VETEKEKNQLFVQLFLKSQRRLYGYVMAIIPNPAEADDIIQDTASLLWSKFDEYQPGTDFAAWALAAARFKVLRCLREKAYRNKFSLEAMATIEQLQSGHVGAEEDTVEALRGCVQRLEQKDRLVLSMRYEEQMTLQGLAGRLGLSVNSVFRQLSRIHIVLLNCIKRAAVE
jgi:RNA polymerase sigma-70 factor (ECF subfamily)